MTDPDTWGNIEEICGGTSQETLSPTENNLDNENDPHFQTSPTDGNTEPPNPLEPDQTPIFAPSLVVNVDEETQMFCDNSPATGESPRDITSPGGGDNSSPFETMESDGLELNDPDCAMFAIGTRRSYEVNHSANFSTTTPGGSSDEDPYASTGSTKKRRRCNRSRRDNMYHSSDKHSIYSPWGSQIPSPVPSGETEDMPSFFRAKMNGVANTSDSNIHAVMAEAQRRLSNASESSLGMAKDGKLLPDFHGTTLPDNGTLSAPQDAKNNKKSPTGTRRRPHHRTAQQRKAQSSSTQTLLTQYPSCGSGCSLVIINQPESQHRARYTSEGSRGPVKDATQQSYPQLQLNGYLGETTLLAFVGSESDDKTKPHGFYQACKVTGRNTTACKEVKTDGTQVIHIPFNTKDVISVDCVGILKLRNADVEARIGVTKAKKKSQTVRLVFRVSLNDVPGHSMENPLILQVVSDRINCTQPQGQPEITKKSLDRCSVIGGAEMFIIGRNFHKGLKVIFQDPEEEDGSHWHEPGQVDKDTFNGNHMVVYVPPYHDQTITKPVNVQVVVEHNHRRCEPHSFTYDPIAKSKITEVEPPPVVESVKEEPGLSSDSLQALLNGVDPKVFALFAKLLTDPNSTKVLPVSLLSQNSPNQQLSAFPPLQASQPVQQPAQPVLFASGLSSNTIEKPTPTPNYGFMQNTISGTSGVIKPAMFGGKNINNQLSNQNQPSQNTTQTAGVDATSNTSFNLLVKSEGQTPFWPEQQKFPNSETSPNSNIFDREIRPNFTIQNQSTSTGQPLQPLQTSTPIQNKTTDFILPSTSWSQHIAPNILNSSSVASTSLFNFPIASTVTVQQPWPPGVEIAGVNLSSQFQSTSQQKFASGIMTSQVVGTNQQQVTNQQNIQQVSNQQNIQQVSNQQNIQQVTNQQNVQQVSNQQNIQQQVSNQQNIQQQVSNQQSIQQQVSNQQNIQQQVSNQQSIQQQVSNQQSIQQQVSNQQNIQQQVSNQQNIQQQVTNQQQHILFQQQKSSQNNSDLQQKTQNQQHLQSHNIFQPQLQQNLIQQPQLQQNLIQQQNAQHQNITQQNVQLQNVAQQSVQLQSVAQQNVPTNQQIWSADQQTNPESTNLFNQNIPQQQLFTLSESIQILDGKPQTLSIPASTQQSYQHILLSPSSESLVQTGGQNSPLVASETGLTLGFENSFTMAENVLPVKQDGSQLLQSIISDCSNPGNASFNTSNNDVTEGIQMQQQDLNSSVEPFFRQSLQQDNENNSGFQNSRDIEMISILNQDQSPNSAEVLESSQSVVDINTFLVNPNSIQPLLRNEHMIVDSSPVNNLPNVSFVDNSSPLLSTTFQQTQQPVDQQVLDQLSPNSQITGIKSELSTIDPSVLNLGNINDEEFVNKTEFNEFSPVLSAANEPNNNFYNN